LTAKPVNGSENGARSGARTLTLRAAPLTVLILQALSSGPKQQGELRQTAGSPAQTTLRAQLRRLSEVGAIERHRRNRFPGVLEHELTKAGQELLTVIEVLEHWLQRAPMTPVPLGGNAAKASIRALAEGWSTTMLRALAASPLSLTELDSVIGSLSYPSLERRIRAMRLAGQVEARQSNGRGTPYGVTNWLRAGVAPLLAAAHWEQCHLPGVAPPLTGIDAEATFLLVIPLLRPGSDISGTCRLSVETSSGSLAGVTVGLISGRIASCATRLRGHSDAWISGPTAAWLSALTGSPHGDLELGGNHTLARLLLQGLQAELFRNDLDVKTPISDDGSN